MPANSVLPSWECTFALSDPPQKLVHCPVPPPSVVQTFSPERRSQTARTPCMRTVHNVQICIGVTTPVAATACLSKRRFRPHTLPVCTVSTLYFMHAAPSLHALLSCLYIVHTTYRFCLSVPHMHFFSLVCS